MKDNKLDEFRRQQAEEDFFRQAAAEIDREETEVFWEAQELPDPPPEVMKRLRNRLQADMQQAARKRKGRRIRVYLSRMAVCVAAVCCLVFTGAYLNVDAAREAVNNFVLDFFDGHAQMQTEKSEEEECGVLMPDNWDGPFAVTWMPERFTSVKSKVLNGCWILMYDDTSSQTNDLSIYVWNINSVPYIDTENMSLVSEITIQGSQAQIYQKANEDAYMLLYAKGDYLIQVLGVADTAEMQKIAENILF